MEGGKRVGLADLLVLFLAVAFFAHQSSARSHSNLDFLAEVMSEESAATAKCRFCVCTKSIPPICFCSDRFNGCPSWCKNCEEADDGMYVCRDRNPDQCKQFSSSDTNRMIELPHDRS